MDNVDQKIQRIMFEAERLNENPVFQEYVKLKKIWVYIPAGIHGICYC